MCCDELAVTVRVLGRGTNEFDSVTVLLEEVASGVAALIVALGMRLAMRSQIATTRFSVVGITPSSHGTSPVNLPSGPMATLPSNQLMNASFTEGSSASKVQTSSPVVRSRA